MLDVDFDFMDKLWCLNEELNHRLDEWSQAMIFTVGVFRNNRSHALELIGDAREANQELHDRVLTAIKSLDSRYQIDIEVLGNDTI
jgi:hypothetical protein